MPKANLEWTSNSSFSSAKAMWFILLSLLALAHPLAALERPPTVRKLDIKGVKAFYSHQVWPLFKSHPHLFHKPIYDERVLDQDIDNLLDYYQKEGYQSASIIEREIREVDKGRGVEIALRVDEGPRTRIGQLEIRGTQLVPADTLRARLVLKPGKVFRQRQLAEDLGNIQQLYAERGMINARLSYQALEDSANTLSLRYEIDEGNPVRVGEIHIRGLSKTHPHVVEREIELKPGQLYSYKLVRASQQYIYSTGLFRTALVEPGPIDSTNLGVRDLIITTRERKAGSLDLGLGYGTSERLRAGLALSQDNWRGLGLQYGLSGRVSRLLRKTEGAFTAPRLYNRSLALDTRLFYEWDRNSTAGFTTDSIGADLTLSLRLARGWLSHITYLLKWVELLETRSLAPSKDRNSTSSIALGFTRDGRNDLLDPRSGTFLQTLVEYAGGPLRGASSFLRSSGTLALYQELGPFVLAGKADIRSIRALNDEAVIFEYERFYLGGDRSVRGFAPKSIGAGRIGLAALSTQSELRFPLRSNTGGVLFVDTGEVWEKVGQIQLSELEPGYGGGLRYRAPIGLVRFDLGFHGGSGSLGKRLEFYLGIGQGF